MTITVSTSVTAPIAEVWRAYTTPEDIVAWNAASDDWHTTTASVDLRVGGAFSSRMEARDGSAGFDFAGTYTEVVTHERIAYEFGGRIATVTFDAQGPATAVTVSFDPEDENSADMQRDGWQAILESFKRHVEAAR
jgi:uncharacterized protein YndB with AHSA1/START domain